MIEPTVPVATWQQRIAAARRRRERWETVWAQYARLHTNAYRAVQAGNEDANALLPSGDQVKVGLVHRNVEQTLAVLEVPEIGVRATAQDATRELGAVDTHREAVVEAALVRSLNGSGLLRGTEEADPIKRDSVIIGHGVVFSYWRIVEEEVELDPVRMLVEAEDGTYEDVLDEETGEPLTERRTEARVVWEGVQDEHVPVLEFLFDSGARSIKRAGWHGREQIVPLAELLRDSRYAVPEWIEPTSYRVRDLYGEDPQSEEQIDDAVRVVTVWDKTHRQLLTFLETDALPPEEAAVRRLTEARAPRKARSSDGRPGGACMNLVQIAGERFPVRFGHPDDSPFNVFVPLPANDVPFGISQIEHIRNQATEVDVLRTRVANLTRQLKRIFLYDKNAGVTQDQIDLALRANDFSFFGLNREEGTELNKLFTEFPMPAIRSELFQQISQAEEDVRKTTGISEVPWGGAGTATESENIMAVGSARVNRKRRLYLAFVAEVARAHQAYLAEFAPDGQTAQVIGDDGLPMLLPYGREALQGNFLLDVQPGGGQTAISPVRQKMLVEAANLFLGRYGPKFDLRLMRQMLTLMDLRDVNGLIQAAREGIGLMPGTMPPAMPGAAPGPRAMPNLNDYTDGQAIRAAINAPNEGAMT